MRNFRKKTVLSKKKEDVDEWLNHAASKKRLHPPWNRIEVIDKAHYRFHFGAFSRCFSWDFETKLLAKDEHCLLLDTVQYPSRGFLTTEIKRLFRYRHKVIKTDLLASTPSKKQRILVTGSTGLIGSQLVPLLLLNGHQVRVLVRNPKKVAPDHMPWDPEKGTILQAMLEGYDTVIHLSGAPLRSGLDHPMVRKEILTSHVESTRFLIETFYRLQAPPKNFICASSASYYGHASRKPCSETATSGKGFLADVAKQTEAIAQQYNKGRTLLLRFGLILGGGGGMLPNLKRKAEFGLLPLCGSGEQRISWIGLDDALYAIDHLIQNPKINGPVNIATKTTTTNRELVEIIAKTCNRKRRLWLPEWILKTTWGSYAKEVLLSDIAIIPNKLNGSDFKWRYPNLEEVIRLHLGRF